MLTEKKEFDICISKNFVYQRYKGKLFFFKQVLVSAIEKETLSMVELYYAVSGLTVLSEKLSHENVDNVIKTVQNALQKDDNLWKYGLLCSYFKLIVCSVFIKNYTRFVANHLKKSNLYYEQLGLYIPHRLRSRWYVWF